MIAAKARARTLLLAAASALLVVAMPAWTARYVPVPGGAFESVLPQGAGAAMAAPVDIAAFEMRETPVTAEEFAAFVHAHPAWRRGQAPAIFADVRYLFDWPSDDRPGDGAGSAPVVNVSWFAAHAFCDAEGARLPSWLEWEYVAAADETRRDARADYAWRQRILAWYSRPVAAGSARGGGAANAYGVRDVHGAVWEWVDDFNALFIAGDSRTQGDPDILKFCGAGAISIVGRDSYAVLMRVALLSSLRGADTTSSLGFRCARDGSR